MLNVLRNLTIWAAAVSFLAVSLIGQGLHVLPGCGHDCGLDHSPATSHGQHGHAGCCVSHQHPQPTPSDSRSSSSTDEEDCSICRLIAQAKVAVAQVGMLPEALSVPDEPAPASVLRVLLFTRPFDARGPPLAV